VAFKVLQRHDFADLQQQIFPIYFSMQTALPAILALTYPSPKAPLGIRSGLQGTFAEANRWSVLAPLATMFIAGVANLACVRPATGRITKERKLQGTI
jgi:hypothetical protein